MPDGAVAAIIVAAGAGVRLGADVPKGLVHLAGEPLLVHAARAFAADPAVTALVAVVSPGHEHSARTVLEHAGLDATVVPGGATRQESVARGLAACPADVAAVAVHDAARALVSAELIRRTLEALQPPWDGVAPGVAMTDTLKLVSPDNGAVLRTVDRRDLWAVQTPQVFARATLADAHAQAGASPALTDDLGLVERAGGRVRLVEGERRNLKITYPEDLVLAEALVRAGAR